MGATTSLWDFELNTRFDLRQAFSKLAMRLDYVRIPI